MRIRTNQVLIRILRKRKNEDAKNRTCRLPAKQQFLAQIKKDNKRKRKIKALTKKRKETILT